LGRKTTFEVAEESGWEKGRPSVGVGTGMSIKMAECGMADALVEDALVEKASLLCP